MTEVTNELIYEFLKPMSEHLDRVERRLELRELAEKSQTPYETLQS